MGGVLRYKLEVYRQYFSGKLYRLGVPEQWSEQVKAKIWILTHNRRRVNRELQTVNWGPGKEGAAESGVKRGLKKAHKPWIRGKNGTQTVN